MHLDDIDILMRIKDGERDDEIAKDKRIYWDNPDVDKFEPQFVMRHLIFEDTGNNCIGDGIKLGSILAIDTTAKIVADIHSEIPDLMKHLLD